MHPIIGKKKTVLIVHDVKKEQREIKVKRIEITNLESKQPTVFKMAGLVIFCGILGDGFDMDGEDWNKLLELVADAARGKAHFFYNQRQLFPKENLLRVYSQGCD